MECQEIRVGCLLCSLYLYAYAFSIPVHIYLSSHAQSLAPSLEGLCRAGALFLDSVDRSCFSNMNQTVAGIEPGEKVGGRWAQLLLCAAFSIWAELAELGCRCYLVARHVCMTLEEKDSNRLPRHANWKKLSIFS